MYRLPYPDWVRTTGISAFAPLPIDAERPELGANQAPPGCPLLFDPGTRGATPPGRVRNSGSQTLPVGQSWHSAVLFQAGEVHVTQLVAPAIAGAEASGRC